MKNKKKKVGIFSLTCDEGCSIYLIEIFNKKLLGWLKKMELKYFLSIKDKVEIRDFDIVLVEGVVSTERDKKEIKKIRKNTKVLITIGTCSSSLWPSGQRNDFSEEQKENIKDQLSKHGYLPKCLPIKDVVKIDDAVPGCPILEQKFISIFESYLNK